MAIDDQQILPAVVVVIEESVPEPNERNCGRGDTCFKADIGERSGTVVLENDVVVIGEGGVHQADVPIVLIVAGSDAHVSCLTPIGIKRIAIQVTAIIESAVAFVDRSYLNGYALNADGREAANMGIA